MRFFSYAPETGMEFHDTQEAAVKAAQECLDSESDNAGDGWAEDVDNICWGVVCGHAAMVNREPAPPGCDCDFYCDYELMTTDDLRATLAGVLESNAKADLAGGGKP
jgi:hypothetical protein